MDRIYKPEKLDEKAVSKPRGGYPDKMFSMYGDAEQEVILDCDNETHHR